MHHHGGGIYAERPEGTRETALDPKKHVDVGRLLVVPRRTAGQEDELRKANRRKNGRPYLYPDSLFAALAVIKSLTGKAYRNLEGMCAGTPDGAGAPDHEIIRRRIPGMDVSIDGPGASVSDVSRPGRAWRFAIDSTGMIPYSRGECMRDKHHVRRPFCKLHVIADAGDGYILSHVLTDDGKGSGDAAHLEHLLDEALEAVGHGSGRGGADARPRPETEIIGDGACGSRHNVRVCGERGVDPVFRYQITTTTKNRGGGRAWSGLVREQLGAKHGDVVTCTNSLSREEKLANQKEWMRRRKYGQRWRAEDVFSSIKRMQGESLWSRTWPNMRQEIRIRVAVYNMVTRMGVQAA